MFRRCPIFEESHKNTVLRTRNLTHEQETIACGAPKSEILGHLRALAGPGEVRVCVCCRQMRQYFNVHVN